jgi:hypothetical protein
VQLQHLQSKVSVSVFDEYLQNIRIALKSSEYFTQFSTSSGGHVVDIDMNNVRQSTCATIVAFCNNQKVLDIQGNAQKAAAKTKKRPAHQKHHIKHFYHLQSVVSRQSLAVLEKGSFMLQGKTFLVRTEEQFIDSYPSASVKRCPQLRSPNHPVPPPLICVVDADCLTVAKVLADLAQTSPGKEIPFVLNVTCTFQPFVNLYTCYEVVYFDVMCSWRTIFK